MTRRLGLWTDVALLTALDVFEIPDVNHPLAISVVLLKLDLMMYFHFDIRSQHLAHLLERPCNSEQKYMRDPRAYMNVMMYYDAGDGKDS